MEVVWEFVIEKNLDFLPGFDEWLWNWQWSVCSRLPRPPGVDFFRYFLGVVWVMVVGICWGTPGTFHETFVVIGCGLC